MASQCRKNNPGNPINDLPPETQTGANTFGCLLDGQAFLPKGDPFAGPILKAAYQFVDGKYHLLINGSHSTSYETTMVGVFADSVEITEGIYELTNKNVPAELYGQFVILKVGSLNKIYLTNSINRGQLIIKKFDTVNQIVSGTFWFDAKNSNNEIVQIREGRFDLPFVR